MLLFASVGARAEALPIQWIGNGHYYDLVSSTLDWSTADAAASASTYLGQQGHLATLTSSAEDLWVFAKRCAAGLRLV